MAPRRLVRVLAAVIAPALLVPTLAPAAHAAATPKVPSLAKVAKIYPHLEGGSFYENPTTKVYGPAKKCNKTKRVKGATGNSASYLEAGATSTTAAKPGVTVVAYRFPSPAKAKTYLKAAQAKTKKCPSGGMATGSTKKAKLKKIKVGLGDQRWGYTVKVKLDSGTYISNMILVRKGKSIVMTLVSSMDGKTPSVKKSIKLTKLTMTTAS